MKMDDSQSQTPPLSPQPRALESQLFEPVSGLGCCFQSGDWCVCVCGGGASLAQEQIQLGVAANRSEGAAQLQATQVLGLFFSVILSVVFFSPYS